MKKSIISAILISWLIVGTLDISLACINAYIKSNTTPDRVLRYIATGVFGKSALSSDIPTLMAALGLIFHYFIALCFTTFFYFIYSKLKWVTINKIVTGIVYGVLIWAVMFFIVLPLSRTPGKSFQFKGAPLSIAILIVAIGIPLSYFANIYYTSRQSKGKHGQEILNANLQ